MSILRSRRSLQDTSNETSSCDSLVEALNNSAPRIVSQLNIMKTYLLFGATLAFLGLATAPLTTQAQTSTSTTTTGYYQASKIVGSKVRSSSGEEIGEIKDVVLDNNGCMAYTVVSTGGTGSRITGTSKTVAVPCCESRQAPPSTPYAALSPSHCRPSSRSSRPPPNQPETVVPKTLNGRQPIDR